MEHKKKAAPAGTGAASSTTFDNYYHTAPDIFVGWFDLVKPSRNRRQKRGWQKGGHHGR